MLDPIDTEVEERPKLRPKSKFALAVESVMWKLRREPHPAEELSLEMAGALREAALDIPHYHHEKWDGTGYPQRSKGEQIPLAARLFPVVDVWDALTSD